MVYRRYTKWEYVQDGKAVVGEVLNLLVPTRFLEVAIAPGVVVEGEEVHTGVISTTVEVLSNLHAVCRDIGGGIANRDLTHALLVGDESLDVAGDGLDVGSGLVSALLVVDDFVAGNEGKGVGVLGKLGDGSQDVLDVVDVVRLVDVGSSSVQSVLGVVDIENQVDASISKSLHALLVVLGVVDNVDTDGVDAEILEVLDVTLANAGVGERVDSLGVATGLVVDTAEEEALVVGVESCKNALATE